MEHQRKNTHLITKHRRLTVISLFFTVLPATFPANAQQEQPSKALNLELPADFTGNSEFKLDEINLLEFITLGDGTTLTLEDIDPRQAVEEFTADQRAGEGVRNITLPDVRRVALENNLNLKAQFVRPSIANERVNEERSRFDMIFSAGLALNQREPLADPGATSITLDGYEADAQLDIPLRSGGTVSIALPTTFTSPDIAGADDVQDTSLSFSYSQPLLRNAGRAIAETPIEIAKLQSSQEAARTKLTAIQTLAGAETAYWEYYSAAKILEVRYEQYERALELERKARRLAEARVVSEIEVIRATSGVARRIEGIILAETQRRIAQRNLKQQLNEDTLPLDGVINLVAETQPSPEFVKLDPGQIKAAAINNRLDLIDTQLQLSVEDLSLLFAKNQEKPLLDLNLNTTFANRGDSFGDSIGSDFTSWQIGARYSIPIGNRGAKARVRRSELQKAQAETNIRVQRRLIEQQVLDALDFLEQSWQRILAARQEVALSGETFNAEERQFLAGVRTSTDVLQAADFLAEAQIREVQALASYEQNKISAALATGTLLGKGQVRLNGIGIR